MGNRISVSKNNIESMVLRGYGGTRNDWEELDPRRPCLVEAVRGHLENSQTGGLILQGSSGSGKRARVNEAMMADCYLERDIHLCGTRYAKPLPYGALHFLLSEMSSEDLESPIAVYEYLKGKLRESGVIPVFVLERADIIDPWTVVVLSQLTYAREIKLIVITNDGESAPPEIMSMAHSGFLSVHRIAPLNVSETKEMIRSISGFPSTDYAAISLWSYSEGNPEWLYALVIEGLRQGILELREGWMVSSGRNLPTGGAVKEVARARLTSLSEEQRRVMGILSVNDSVRTGQLDDSQVDVVDSLFESGFLVHSTDAPGIMSIKSRILKDSLLSMHLNDPSTRNTAKASSKDAVTTNRFPIVVECKTSSALEHSEIDPVATIRREIESLIREGKAHEALAVIADYRTRNLPRGRYVSGWIAKALDISQVHDAFLVLELQVSVRLDKTDSLSDLINILNPAGGDGRLKFMEWPLRLEATAYIAEALLKLHRWSESLPIVKWLGRQILKSEGFLTSATHNWINTRTVRSLLSSSIAVGEWPLSRSLLALVGSEQLADPVLVDFASAVRAILLIAKDEVKEAAGILRPLEKQLLASGPPEEHEAVASLLAYCNAESGNLEASAQYLYVSPCQKTDESPYGWIVEFFRAMSIAQLHSPDARNLRLLALGQSPTTLADPLLRMYALAISVRQGNLEAAHDLEEITEGISSGLAEAFHRFAQGVKGKNTLLVTESLVSLVELGFAAFADDSGEPFVLLNKTDQRTIHRKVKAVARSENEVHSWNGKKLESNPVFSSLTQREKYIASAAAGGLTNSEIAGMASVSVRTVEGHLYQIYAKLGLRGRAGLTELLSSSMSCRETAHAGR